MHNTSLFHGSSGGIQGWGLSEALACFDRIVVHSDYSQRAALDNAMVEREQLRIIPHGAFDYYKQFAQGVVRSSGPVQLLFAGSIKPYKGVDVLVSALPTLASLCAPGSWHLTIAGHSGDQLDALKQTISRSGLDPFVTWSLRHQTERELGQLLGHSDVVVLPYREIDQSGVLLAAVGMERPVVASKVGAFPELLRDEQHGLLVPPEDPVALGNALARLVVDRGLRTYCEQQMHQLAAGSLNWSTIGRATLDLYLEIAHT
jgi:glycosyltransferase involved in cell wall biosynthesis